MKIYKCDICSNILLAINDSGVTPHCCNSEMNVLIPEEASLLNEHYIRCSVKDMENYAIVSLYVGKERLHPMNENHHIEWVILNTDKGHYIHRFNEEDTIPHTSFLIGNNEKVISAQIYCNLHSLYENSCKSSS